MTNTRAWVTLSTLLGVISALTVSCGSDEVTGKPPVGEVFGGSSGTGGSGGGGGNAGRSSGGTNASGGGGNRVTNLGKACVNDASCGNSSGLQCVSDPAVPQGLCSASCESNDDCNAISPGGVCAGGLCLEGCQVGAVTGLADKCHDRDDFSCRALDSQPTNKSCTQDEDCPNGSICDDTQGTCLTVITACQPTCNSNDDCASGFCNIGTGLCQEEAPTGSALGAKCDPDKNPDPCSGFCISDSTGFAMCTGYCSFGVRGGCGWNGVGPADGACWFGPRYEQSVDVHDVGYCVQLCDCNADCRHPDTKCVAFAGIQNAEDLPDVYMRQGICAPVEPGDKVQILETCAGGGQGGTGGAGGAGGESGGGGTGGGAETGGSTGEGGSGASTGAGADGGGGASNG